jgi:hypothetical protein
MKTRDLGCRDTSYPTAFLECTFLESNFNQRPRSISATSDFANPFRCFTWTFYFGTTCILHFGHCTSTTPLLALIAHAVFHHFKTSEAQKMSPTRHVSVKGGYSIECGNICGHLYVYPKTSLEPYYRSNHSKMRGQSTYSRGWPFALFIGCHQLCLPFTRPSLCPNP